MKSAHIPTGEHATSLVGIIAETASGSTAIERKASDRGSVSPHPYKLNHVLL